MLRENEILAHPQPWGTGKSGNAAPWKLQLSMFDSAATKYIPAGNASSQGNCTQPLDKHGAFQTLLPKNPFPTAPSRALSPWGGGKSWEQPQLC